MSKPVILLAAVFAIGVLAVWGLRSDLAACTAAPDQRLGAMPPPAAEPGGPVRGGVEAGGGAQGYSGSGGAVDDISPFGIVAPVFSGFGVDSYSTKCDPFDDPYGSCL